MYKHVIKFEDFEGNPCTTEVYFNLTKTECVDLNLMYEEDGGLIEHIKSIMAKREDGTIRQKPAVDFVKMLIDKSYGVRPKDDLTLFLKEDDAGRPLYKKFKQSAAYDEFVYAIMSGEIPLDEFASKVLPTVNDTQKAEAREMLRKEGLGELVDRV